MGVRKSNLGEFRRHHIFFCYCFFVCGNHAENKIKRFRELLMLQFHLTQFKWTRKVFPQFRSKVPFAKKITQVTTKIVWGKQINLNRCQEQTSFEARRDLTTKCSESSSEMEVPVPWMCSTKVSQKEIKGWQNTKWPCRRQEKNLIGVVCGETTRKTWCNKEELTTFRKSQCQKVFGHHFFTFFVTSSVMYLRARFSSDLEVSANIHNSSLGGYNGRNLFLRVFDPILINFWTKKNFDFFRKNPPPPQFSRYFSYTERLFQMRNIFW